MLKKIIIAGIILLVVAVGVFFIVPWGEYESKLEKSELEEVVAVDSVGNTVPTLSLISGTYYVKSGEESQAELLFDVDGLKSTKGAFEEFEVDFAITEDFTQSTLTVTIQSATINTGNGMRDEHLAEEDFFNVGKFPTIVFASNSIAQSDTGYVATGNLSLIGNTQPLDLPFKHLGKGTDLDGNDFEAFEGSFVFDRIAYGMEEISGAGNIVTVNFYCELLAK